MAALPPSPGNEGILPPPPPAHEWAEKFNGTEGSLNDFYNHYLEKTDSSVIRPSSLKFTGASENILFVIDMQNDFVKPSPEGAFSVADGVKMAQPLLTVFTIK
jgi:hypothetical protein